jgi:ABC-2 type transport system permease protein
MYFLSSAIFPLNGVPRALKALAIIDPLTYGIDGLRGAMTGVHFFHPATDLAVLGGFAALLLLLGTYLFSRIQL